MKWTLTLGVIHVVKDSLTIDRCTALSFLETIDEVFGAKAVLRSDHIMSGTSAGEVS